MIKTFKELTALDLTQYIQKKPTTYNREGLDYIEWSKVLELLYDNGAESVAFTSEISLTKPNTLIIELVIDSKVYRLDYPIINGNIAIKEPNQLQIHTSELRGFVKAVAVYTGLGLSLWQKEERLLSEITENTKIKVSAKKLLEGAKSIGELNRIWGSLDESEQVKFKDTFTTTKEKLG
jgi:hypothetical protein